MADYDSGIIEEVIEETPGPSVAVTSELPSWWTDDDKSQFVDDSKASAARSASWDLPKSDRGTEDYTPTATDSHNESFAATYEEPNSVEEQSIYSNASATGAAWNIDRSEELQDIDERDAEASSESGSVIAGIPFGAIERGSDEPRSESDELDSLLARFGLARQTETDTESENRGRKCIERIEFHRRWIQ